MHAERIVQVLPAVGIVIIITHYDVIKQKMATGSKGLIAVR